jgi:hypothetical protein
MTYDQSNETLRFVWRNESFRFRGFGCARVPNETDGRPMGDRVGRSGGPSCTKALEVGATRWHRPEHRVWMGGQKRPTPSLLLRSVSFDKLRAKLSRPPYGASERGFGEFHGAKKAASKRT